MITNKIVWEKWIDPLNKNIDEVEYPGYNAPSTEEDRAIEFLSTDENFEQSLEDMDSQDLEGRKNIIYNPIRIASTSHGFVTLTEHSYASKHFDFWTLHYTDNITKEIADVVEKCRGVETVDILTRYRMRIGFNRPLVQAGAFKLNDLRKGIESAILGQSKKKDILNNFSKVVKERNDINEQDKQ